jgi:hypothetical protein
MVNPLTFNRNFPCDFHDQHDCTKSPRFLRVVFSHRSTLVLHQRNRKATLKLLRKAIKRHGRPKMIVTALLRSYSAAMKIIGNAERQEIVRWLNNRAENSHS